MQVNQTHRSIESDLREGLCVACGVEFAHTRPVVRARAPRIPFDLHRCPTCGLVQQFPRYGLNELDSLYADEYYVHGEDDGLRWGRAVQQYLIHLRPREAGRYRRLLDLGCATGHLAAIAEQRGWRVVGLDLSAHAISRASVRFALDVRAGQLSLHAETLGAFDVVFLGDLIEHVPDPVALLTSIRRVLVPGGEVLIDTPNWGSRWRRWGGSHWLGLNRFHISLFDPGALARLLESRQFVDIKMGSYTHYRYEPFAARPEVQALIGRLPDALAWRINRGLGHRGSSAAWRGLIEHPPATLPEAMGVIRQSGREVQTNVSDTLARDNLIAAARRPRCDPARRE